MKSRLRFNSRPPTRTAFRPSGRVTGAAEWMIMPRVSAVRSVGTAASVATSGIAARAARPGDRASSWAASRMSTALCHWPCNAPRMTGQSAGEKAAWPSGPAIYRKSSPSRACSCTRKSAEFPAANALRKRTDCATASSSSPEVAVSLARYWSAMVRSPFTLLIRRPSVFSDQRQVAMPRSSGISTSIGSSAISSNRTRTDRMGKRSPRTG